MAHESCDRWLDSATGSISGTSETTNNWGTWSRCQKPWHIVTKLKINSSHQEIASTCAFSGCLCSIGNHTETNNYAFYHIIVCWCAQSWTNPSLILFALAMLSMLACWKLCIRSHARICYSRLQGTLLGTILTLKTMIDHDYPSLSVINDHQPPWLTTLDHYRLLLLGYDINYCDKQKSAALTAAVGCPAIPPVAYWYVIGSLQL